MFFYWCMFFILKTCKIKRNQVGLWHWLRLWLKHFSSFSVGFLHINTLLQLNSINNSNGTALTMQYYKITDSDWRSNVFIVCFFMYFITLKKHVFKCFFYLLITVFIIYAENDWKMAFSLHVFESVSDDYNFWLIFRL